MQSVFELAEAYREEIHLEPRIELAGKLAEVLAPELRIFVISRVNPSIADDIMQETMKDIFTHFFKFRGKTEKEFWKWCFIITRNKTADRLRWDHKSLKYYPAEELMQLADAIGAESPTASLEDRDDVRQVLKLLEQVARECRSKLWDYYVVGLDYDEMAEGLGLSYDAIRMSIKRCLELARDLYNGLK
jgi:RNA polymerase sigma factor (sigma-70 family)